MPKKVTVATPKQCASERRKLKVPLACGSSCLTLLYEATDKKPASNSSDGHKTLPVPHRNNMPNLLVTRASWGLLALPGSYASVFFHFLLLFSLAPCFCLLAGFLFSRLTFYFPLFHCLLYSRSLFFVVFFLLLAFASCLGLLAPCCLQCLL